jgi:hypothetical protein
MFKQKKGFKVIHLIIYFTIFSLIRKRLLLSRLDHEQCTTKYKK